MSTKATGLDKMRQAAAVHVTINPDGDTPAEEKDEGYDEYHLKRCADVLAEAAEIKADPKLMAALKGHIGKKAAAYKSLDQLRKLGDRKKAVGE